MRTGEPITCAEALRLLALYLDGELHHGQRASVDHHLAACRSCYSRSEFERRLKTELGRLRRDDVRPGFERQIRHLITQFTAIPVSLSGDE